MNLQLRAALTAALALFSFASQAQERVLNLRETALVLVFRKDASNLVCSPAAGISLAEMDKLLQPYTEGVDLGAQESYRKFLLAVYRAFPCPFSSERPELRPATREDVKGVWSFSGPSVRLRFGPKSPNWQKTPNIPPLSCEAAAFHESGGYSVVEMHGSQCPSVSFMEMRAMQPVQFWTMDQANEVSITRPDVPELKQRWDAYVVETAFSFFGVDFEPGDLLMYLRREPGNEIGATTAFRHFRAMK